MTPHAHEAYNGHDIMEHLDANQHDLDTALEQSTTAYLAHKELREQLDQVEEDYLWDVYQDSLADPSDKRIPSEDKRKALAKRHMREAYRHQLEKLARLEREKKEAELTLDRASKAFHKNMALLDYLKSQNELEAAKMILEAARLRAQAEPEARERLPFDDDTLPF